MTRRASPEDPEADNAGPLFAGLFDEPAEHETPPAEASLRAAFHAFHEANPHVYALFERFALEAIGYGRKRFSARMIWYRMRWYTDIETTGEPFKLNDHFTPYMARLFLERHPEHDGLFELRRVQDPAASPDSGAR